MIFSGFVMIFNLSRPKIKKNPPQSHTVYHYYSAIVTIPSKKPESSHRSRIDGLLFLFGNDSNSMMSRSLFSF